MSRLGRRDIVEQIVSDLARLVQSGLLYPVGNERTIKAAERVLALLGEWNRPFRLSLIGSDAVAEDRSIEDPAPVEKLLITKMRQVDWESLRIDPGVRSEGLMGMVGRIVEAKRGPYRGAGLEAGYLTLETAQEHRSPITNAVVGYLGLVSGAKEAVTGLGAKKQEGLSHAREVVASLAGHLASGHDVFRPVRQLKNFDEYTFTHALNVSILALVIGKALGIGEAQLNEISLGALCHDVGKERIPEKILNKPSVLTVEEMAVMRRHPEEGARTLLEVQGMERSLLPVIAFQHHMYFDGTGYPARLPARRPHPASMLVAVADVYDALRTVRPYRAPNTEEQAFTIMLREARRGRLVKRFLGPLAGLLGVISNGRSLKLSDGREVIVERENTLQPLLPVVKPGDGEPIDLAEHPQLSITGVYNAPLAGPVNENS